MADTLESLELEVKYKATGAAGEIAQVTNAISGLGAAVAKVLPQLQMMAKTLESVCGTKNVTHTVQQIGSAAKSAAQATAPVSDSLQEMISGASEVELLQYKLDSLTASMQQAFDSGDAKKAAALRAQIVSTEKALERAGKSASNASKGVKELAKEASKSQKPLSGFIASLKRIAFYRMIRSIIKSIAQAMQEGLEKAYIFSSGIDGEGYRFAAAMDRIKGAGNAMKGQLGSAFISLLAAVEPVLIALINLVTRAADAIAQLLAAFTGKTYLKANVTAAKFADTMARGGAAAKEWKNQLLGFDEINRLNAPSDGGGGGGGANPLNGFEFVDTPINEKLLQFINNIKEKLQPAIDRLKDAFGSLKEAWGKFVDSLGSSAFSQFIEDVLVLASETVINGLTILTDVLTPLLNILSGDLMSAEMSFRQLLYDIIVAVSDLIVGVTNLAMDALIMLVQGIDSVIGTNFASYLQEDKDAFNAMYRESVTSTDGLFGLKAVLGLTEKATEKVSDKTDGLTEALAGVSAKAPEAEQKINGIRGALDWVADGFRWFGGEVAAIFTSLFQPIADFCAWIDSAIQGLSIFRGLGGRVSQMHMDGSVYLQGFASGGFPEEGQLFFANENGAEMVGSMGGRTAVANNQEITEGIRQAVYDAMTASNANGNNDVSVRVYLDSREIKAGQQRLNRAWGVG